MRIIRIRKGMDLPLDGKAVREIRDIPPPAMLAVKPTDFIGFQPRLLVRSGDQVKAGTPLFCNKSDERIIITAPASGTVAEIVRGDKRLLEEIRIACDAENAYEAFGKLQNPDRAALISYLLKSGVWPLIRQRPYDIIPNPDLPPRDIYISTFDSSPLAPDYAFILKSEAEVLQAGIDALVRLTDGKVHLGLSAKADEGNVFETLQRVEKHYFRGPHPAGNVGVQIHHTQAINKGETIWYLNIADLAVIGRLMIKGICDMSRIVAVTGPEAAETYYARTIMGVRISDIAKCADPHQETRVISGNVLTGTQVEADGFLGYYHHQLTLIPEGKYHEFIGWTAPGFKKFSASNLFMSRLIPPRKYKLDTNLHGGVRAYVMSGQYEKVFPFDIYPVYLIKAIMVNDIDKMEQLGIYEVSPEDFALCDVVCTSKIEVQQIVADGLEMIRKEMS